ncbi:MAG: ComF family protein [Flavobacteriaceae bacterium]|nr:ComF family protein [Flavobacteriaceae bacterium]
MLNILFPRMCNGCKQSLLKNEEIICANCRHNLPLACFHRYKDPEMKSVFYGRFPVENATSLIRFQKKGITQQILHNLKYRGREEISGFFGKWLGAELSEEKEYQHIDLVIPVPLHKKKLKKRGYNQVSGFGAQIARKLGVPFREDILVKISKTKSQVFKKRLMRFGTESVFEVQNNQSIKGKHLLLVDDIVTTGATLENCAQKLMENNSVKLSVATIAIA